MNHLSADMIKLLESYGVIENEDRVLESLSKNIDRAKLCREIIDCKQCPLHKSTMQKVMGEGPKESIMIIGDFSGEIENATGRPFSGPSGDLLDKLLDDACMDRRKIYITNAIKCHPPYGRDPEVNELESCARAFLSKELQIIKPRHIIAMGVIASSLFTTENLIQVRGKTIESKGFPVTFTYHPSYILRKKNEEYTRDYNLVVNDLCHVIMELNGLENPPDIEKE